ncbi:hypothetical protein [Alkalimarinus alittae]|uniref:Uncharacterized protein n=1 Tax=Alkalimarinus alittae TaxID=2961619 RepID=A0ABY6N472_9ALTE|nr:hypothetical protein [Alkalimarinus alittae]UZE96884.1 hypothetical protein NKI27_03795 [Alkalimarinus alittae]
MLIKEFIALPLMLTTLLSANSLADLTLLSDSELAQSTAQNGLISSSFGSTPFSQSVIERDSRYIESKKVESLYLSSKVLAERGLYFSELNHPTIADNAQLAEQLERSLLTLSTLISSSVTMSGLLPVLGFPISVGVSVAPEAFDVQVNGVNIDISMDVTINK